MKKIIQILFLRKKRKIPDFANKNTNEDISSEETQRIHRNSKIKKEKKLSHKPNRKIESIPKNTIDKSKNIKKKIKTNNSIGYKLNNNKIQKQNEFYLKHRMNKMIQILNKWRN